MFNTGKVDTEKYTQYIEPHMQYVSKKCHNMSVHVYSESSNYRNSGRNN